MSTDTTATAPLTATTMARRLAPLETPPPLPAELTELPEWASPAMVLRAMGRGDDPLSLTVEWRDLPTQVSLATAARTLASILDGTPWPVAG